MGERRIRKWCRRGKKKHTANIKCILNYPKKEGTLLRRAFQRKGGTNAAVACLQYPATLITTMVLFKLTSFKSPWPCLHCKQAVMDHFSMDRFSTTTSSHLEFLHHLVPSELLHHLVPSSSWAAVGPPWRACAAAPAPGACCIPAGWWARSGAGAGSARSASSGWCWDGGTPAPAWTRAGAAAWHAPGPSVSAFCLAPNRRTEGIIRFFVLTWISVHKVTFHFVRKGISLFPRHLRTDHRVSWSYQQQTAMPPVTFPSSFHFSSSCSRCSTGFTVSIFC